jgi:hypothetical protein
MSVLRAKALAPVVSACLLMGPVPSWAQTIFNPNAPASIFDIYPAIPPQCLAVVRLGDGSWLARQPLQFRGARVGAGAILWRGTYLGGIDVGALLHRECGGREIPPTVRF